MNIKLFSFLVLSIFTTHNLCASHTDGAEPNINKICIRDLSEIVEGDLPDVAEPALKKHAPASKLNRGDLLFIDIDGVILSEGGSKSEALLMPGAQEFFRNLRNRGVILYGLTARSENRMLETCDLLRRYGIHFSQNRPAQFRNRQATFYRGIIFSPNIHEQDKKKSRKILTLASFLGDLGMNPQKVFFVDNEDFHFDTPKEVLGRHQDQCYFFHFNREFQPLYSTLDAPAPKLEDLKFMECKSGGTGGVVILQDPSGKKWTLKGWESKAHGFNE
ncbi:MAG: DUF2608 domain-containing protein [Alphaproteobacteria bacterium]|nr:DUF2608 domain-containing protein [Alphaproteobacteria bacterium]